MEFSGHTSPIGVIQLCKQFFIETNRSKEFVAALMSFNRRNITVFHPSKIEAMLSMKISLGSGYLFLAFLGTVLNMALIISLFLYRVAMKNTTNLFILTLALSDVFQCTIVVPVLVSYDYFDYRLINADWYCQFIFLLFGLPMYISCLTIMIIAIDRHRSVTHIHVVALSRKTVGGVIVAVVLFSLLNISPVAIFTRKDGTLCIESWPSRSIRLIYSVFVYALLFLLPLLMSITLYTRIYLFLQKNPFRNRNVERKKFTNRILLYVVVLNALCWMPWCTYSLILEIMEWFNAPNPCVLYLQTFQQRPNADQMPPFRLIDSALKMLAIGSASLNPVLYGWLNRPVREAMMNGICAQPLVRVLQNRWLGMNPPPGTEATSMLCKDRMCVTGSVSPINAFQEQQGQDALKEFNKRITNNGTSTEKEAFLLTVNVPSVVSSRRSSFGDA